MSINKKKVSGAKVSKTAIAFYVLSALLMIGFLLTVYNVTVYIQSLLSAGSISLTANWMDVVNNTAIYLALSALLFGMGYVIAYIKGKSVKTVKEVIEDNVEEVVEDDNEEVNDILEETKTEEEL